MRNSTSSWASSAYQWAHFETRGQFRFVTKVTFKTQAMKVFTNSPLATNTKPLFACSLQMWPLSGWSREMKVVQRAFNPPTSLPAATPHFRMCKNVFFEVYLIFFFTEQKSAQGFSQAPCPPEARAHCVEIMWPLRVCFLHCFAWLEDNLKGKVALILMLK